MVLEGALGQVEWAAARKTGRCRGTGRCRRRHHTADGLGRWTLAGRWLDAGRSTLDAGISASPAAAVEARRPFRMGRDRKMPGPSDQLVADAASSPDASGGRPPTGAKPRLQ
ncbi:hypothetical protein E4U53_004385 [Claviceps sorghi]|nr:hypothetical protein E4U53_004385 [Claviceps sorghi]